MRQQADEKIIHVTELISGICIVITAIFLLLAGLNVFPFSIGECWLISVFVCFFVISLFIAILQKNHIGIFFTSLWFLLILSQILVLIGLAHRQIYPIYVVAVPLGLINTTVTVKAATKLFKIAFTLTVAGLLLFLESMSVLSIGIVLTIIVLYFGLLGIVYAVIKLRKEKTQQGDK